LKWNSIVFEELPVSIGDFSVANIHFADSPQHCQYACIC